MADEEERQGEGSRQDGSREAAEEHRCRRQQRELEEDEEGRGHHGCAHRVVGDAQHDGERDQHEENVGGQHQQQTEIAAEQEASARDRLRQRREDGAPLDLSGDESHADEDRDEHSRQLDGREAQVEDDAVPLPDRELGDEQRPGDEEHREEEQVVEKLVADQLPHRVGGDHRHRPDELAHRTSSPAMAPWRPRMRRRCPAVERAAPDESTS